MNNKTKNIALGGILVSLTIITLYLSIIIPSNTISFLTLSSIFVPIAIIQSDLKTGVLVYIGSTIFSFLFIPLDTSILFFIYFGSYGIIKYLIERLNNRPIEMLLKIIISNILIFISYKAFKLLGLNIDLVFPKYIFFFIIQIFIILYDYSLSLLITYYLKRFKNKI